MEGVERREVSSVWPSAGRSSVRRTVSKTVNILQTLRVNVQRVSDVGHHLQAESQVTHLISVAFVTSNERKGKQLKKPRLMPPIRGKAEGENLHTRRMVTKTTEMRRPLIPEAGDGRNQSQQLSSQYL